MSRRPSSPSSGQRGPFPPDQPSFNRQNSSASARQPSSSARFEYEDGDPRSQRAPPSRPERSMRRPINTPSPTIFNEGRFPDQDDVRGARRAGMQEGRLNVSEAMIRSTSTSSGGTDEGNAKNGGLVNASNGDKSRRMMERLDLNSGSNPPAAVNQPLRSPTKNPPRRRRDSIESASSQASSAVGSPATSPRIPSPRKASTAPTKEFTPDYGQNGAPPRRDGRRGAAGEQGIASVAVRKKVLPDAVTLNAHDYPDTPAFREIESVLRTIKSDWPILLQGTSEEVSQEIDKDYDPVALALSLLNPTNVGTAVSLPAFMRLKLDLDHAISSSLASSSSSYRAYESSITTYNSTLASLAASVKVVGSLKQGLGAAREKLEGKGKEGLSAMYNRMNHLEEMIKILDEIDHLRSVPDRLEALMSEKRFLSAVILLVRSMKMINKSDMMEIGALSDLRAWMIQQEGVLLEILIEELHNHLYLKSFFCDARWKSYSRGQTELPLVDFGEDFDPNALPPLPDSTIRSSGRSNAHLPQQSKLQRYLNALSLRPSHNPILDEPIDDVGAEQATTTEDELGRSSFSLPGFDSATVPNQTRAGQKNPEMDSFVYVESLIESLAMLGKLGYGLDAISQRVQIEMFNLVEATLEEVDERNDSTRHGSASNRSATSFLFASANNTRNLATKVTPHRGSLVSLSSLSATGNSANRSSLLRLTASETNALEMNVETLKDLFWTLYSKLDAVLQGFRVTYEVSLRIAERRDFKDSSIIKTSSGSLIFSLIEVWKPVQQEVRALLHDYLTDDQSGTVSSRNPITSVNEILRAAKPNRDHTKQIFKFADSDLKASSKALKFHEDELNRALKFAVPGLMTDGPSLPGQIIVNSSDDRYGIGKSGSGGTHKALVSADAFNVSILFGPTLAFLDRVKDIMPADLMSDHDTSGFAGFLDEFVLRTFLPQLEEKVTNVFHQAVGGQDAFQEDPNYKKISPVPIVKSVSNLMLLISSLCSMLRSTAFHRENYSHLIVSVIHQFYQRCNKRFKDLVSKEPSDNPNRKESDVSPLKAAATWAEAGEVYDCLTEIRSIDPTDTARMKEALKRETKIELERKGNSQIRTDDLLNPSKKLLALGTLYSSLDWFIVHVSSLKTAEADAGFTFTSPGQTPPISPNFDANGSNTISLPLTREMAQPFEALLRSYQQLADSVLYTIRLEVRLRTIHFLDKATREGIYQLSEDIAEPDSAVVDLNSSLAEMDECASNTLAGPERRFIFEGLSLLMDQLLITNSRYIRLANHHGLAKMNRNILALQQNLKNIGDEPLPVDFDRSRKFWEVFGGGPQQMLESIRNRTIDFEFEDYKSLLNLQCGIDQSSKDEDAHGEPQSATGDRSRRRYNEFLIDLFSLDVE